MACKALDGQVAVPQDKELAELLDQYVCVRLVQMWGTDLSRFEFDYALTWAVFLMHADGTIYARYGSRQAYGAHTDDEMSTEGFKKTLRGALALHQRYVAAPRTVGLSLAGKAGAAAPWKTPEAIPSLKTNGRFQQRFAGRHERNASCIHCHMVAVNEVVSLRAAKRPIPDRKLWPFPMPNAVGLAMDPAESATVESVAPGSVAARAGFRSGDRIRRLDGQPILSTADIQWVLHNAADPQTLRADVERGGKTRRLELPLARGWRAGLADWRFFNGALQVQLLGFDCVAERGGTGLRVNRVRRGAGGMRRGDIVVAVDGKRQPMTRGGFTAYVYRSKAPGDTLKLTLRRDDGERDVEITIR